MLFIKPFNDFRSQALNITTTKLTLGHFKCNKDRFEIRMCFNFL